MTTIDITKNNSSLTFWRSSHTLLIELKALVPGHWKFFKRVKHVTIKIDSNNFPKTVFPMRDILKIFQNSKLLFLRNPLYICKIYTTRKAYLTNELVGKDWHEDSLGILRYDGRKYLSQRIRALLVNESWLIVNSRMSINLKTRVFNPCLMKVSQNHFWIRN